MINLRDKSLGTSFINLTYFNFPCCDEHPLRLVKFLKYYEHDCLRKQFFVISALSTLLGAKWFDVEPRKTSFLKFFYPLDTFYFDSRPKFSLFVKNSFQKF